MFSKQCDISEVITALLALLKRHKLRTDLTFILKKVICKNEFIEKKPTMEPKTLAELLPEISSILSVEKVITNTGRNQSRQTLLPHTAEKMKPLTLAEMRSELLALKPLSPRRPPKQDMSTKEKGWNSSVKVVKKTNSHTADGQIKHNSVRKVLNFQSKTRTPNSRATIMNSETPKFPNPNSRVKNSLHIQSKPNVRISGVCNIPETPVTTNKILDKRFTMQHNFNKENISYLSDINKKEMASPKPNFNINPLIPDTPISNISFKSCDASFLQKEKEINDIEEKIKMLVEKPILENIAEISPPVSTPFKEYRNVKDFFNNNNENFVVYNDTIKTFIKDTEHKDRSNGSEIVSLCNLLNKAIVDSINSTELSDLAAIKKQTEISINVIKNHICTLQNINEAQEKIIKLINEEMAKKISDTENDTTVVAVKQTEVKIKETSPQKSPMLRASAIKIKSPSYIIAKKTLSWRRKGFHKSMPDVANDQKTPEKNDKALNMYMQIKEKMNFLNTPLVKHRNIQAIDTPTATSYTLQMQLNKLYNAS